MRFGVEFNVAEIDFRFITPIRIGYPRIQFRHYKKIAAANGSIHSMNRQ